MKEINFLDRVPTYPGRVRLTPVSGDLYDMERADEPVVAGSPLDKATFNSIIHSRLTGRYYRPTVSQTVVSTETMTVNPVPTGGWINESNAKSRSGAYLIEASTAEPGYSVERAFDGDRDTAWHSLTAGTSHHIQLRFSQPITVKKIRWRATYAPNNHNIVIAVQGSNNGVTWTELHSVTYSPTTFGEISLTRTGEFSYYRLAFSSTGEVYAYVYEWQISEYDVHRLNNNYTIADGVPTVWTEGQKITIQTPSDANDFGVVSNSLNGVHVNTILQPSKRYELVYTGSAFVAKEV